MGQGTAAPRSDAWIRRSPPQPRARRLLAANPRQPPGLGKQAPADAVCRVHTGAAARRQSGADGRPAVARSPRNGCSVRPEPRRRPIGRWRCGRRVAVEQGGFDGRSAGHQPAPTSHIGTDEPSGRDHSTIHTDTAVLASDQSPEHAPDNAPNHAADYAADYDTDGDDHGHPGRYRLADAVSDAVPAGGERSRPRPGARPASVLSSQHAERSHRRAGRGADDRQRVDTRRPDQARHPDGATVVPLRPRGAVRHGWRI